MFPKALEFIAEGKYLAFSLAVVIGLLFNAQKVLAFTDSFKKRRIELLKEAIGVSNINESLKSHFEDEIEGEYFRLAHKVRMDKGLRDACLELYSKLGRSLTFVHFIRARQHLELSDGSLHVNISTFDKIGYYYNLVVGFCMLLLGILGITLIATVKEPTIISILTWLGMCFFSMSFGVFMLSQTFSITSAKKIRTYIQE